MIIRILDPAKVDLLDGFFFYEKQEENIGDFFLNTLYSDIDSLRIYAGIHRKKFGYYWMLSKRFPFSIYYEIENETILVHSVIDCRQNPETIAQRLNEERTRRWS